MTVTLNRPQAAQRLRHPHAAAHARAVLRHLAGPGCARAGADGRGDAFCTGGDVKSLGAPDPDDPIAQRWGTDPSVARCRGAHRPAAAFIDASLWLHRMGKPTIAMVRGAAAGAGLALALACDFRIVSRTAFFLDPRSPRSACRATSAAAYFLTQLVGPAKAKELYMLGDRIDAEEVERLGLATCGRGFGTGVRDGGIRRAVGGRAADRIALHQGQTCMQRSMSRSSAPARSKRAT